MSRYSAWRAHDTHCSRRITLLQKLQKTQAILLLEHLQQFARILFRTCSMNAFNSALFATKQEEMQEFYMTLVHRTVGIAAALSTSALVFALTLA
ncbi:hypothetical protein AB3M93_08665 [Novosphingobium panipatense]|uniref:hypothetical protein n=1 Tax=Novosphingobium panipatense TaxID=428991 RepID=UPI0011AF4B75